MTSHKPNNIERRGRENMATCCCWAFNGRGTLAGDQPSALSANVLSSVDRIAMRTPLAGAGLPVSATNLNTIGDQSSNIIAVVKPLDGESSEQLA